MFLDHDLHFRHFHLVSRFVFYPHGFKAFLLLDLIQQFMPSVTGSQYQDAIHVLQIHHDLFEKFLKLLIHPVLVMCFTIQRVPEQTCLAGRFTIESIHRPDAGLDRPRAQFACSVHTHDGCLLVVDPYSVAVQVGCLFHVVFI